MGEGLDELLAEQVLAAEQHTVDMRRTRGVIDAGDCTAEEAELLLELMREKLPAGDAHLQVDLASAEEDAGVQLVHLSMWVS